MNSVVDSEFKKLEKFYVYVLVNSETEDVFYVGKGQGERALQHELEAQNGGETPKLEMIRKIKKAGYETIVRVIGRYKTEEEAFAVESTLIHWVYGYDNLTNQAGGHGCNRIRPHGNSDEIEEIDIPKRVNNFNGVYSQEERAKRDKNKIVPYMKDIKGFLEKELGVTFSDVNINEARFTTLSFELENSKIVIGTGHSPTKLLWIELQAFTGCREDKDKILHICNNSSLEARSNGQYAKLPNFQSTLDRTEISECFLKLKEEVEKSEAAANHFPSQS